MPIYFAGHNMIGDGMAGESTQLTADQGPKNQERREALRKIGTGMLILANATALGRLLLPADVHAQTPISKEKALAWAQEPSASNSAPFGAKTISVNPGKASLSISSNEVDITGGLKKIGLQALSSEAKIAYGGKEGKDAVYFVTDKDSLGVLKVMVSEKESISFDSLAYPTSVVSGIKVVDSGFSFSAASPLLAATLNGTAVRFFDFGEVRIRRTDLAGFMKKEDSASLKGLRVVAKKEGTDIYLVIAGDKTENIYVFDPVNKAVQTFPKEGN